MSSVFVIWGEGRRKKEMGGKGRNEAGTAKCTPRLARSSNETWGLSQELGHRRNLGFPGCGTASSGMGSLPGSLRSLRFALRRQSPARPGPAAELLWGNGEPAGVPAMDKIL